MSDKLKEWWYYTGRGVVLMIFFIWTFGVLLFLGVNYASRSSCEAYGFATETPTKYVRHHCYVKLDGRWHDRDDLRVRQ